MRLLITTAILLVPCIGAAEPRSGSLNGPDDDFLTYRCDPSTGDSLQCSFTQIQITPKLDPNEVEAMIAEQLPGAISEMTGDDWPEVCKQIQPLSTISRLMINGDDAGLHAYVSQLPPDIRDGIDLEDMQSGIERSGERGLDDALEAFAILDRLCSEPSEANMESFLRNTLEKEARTCHVYVNNWEGQFNKVTDTLWSLEQSGPSGTCSVVRLDRFECEPNSLLCEFVSEKRVLSADREGPLGISCADLDESQQRYEIDIYGVYLGCEILSFH